MSLAAPPRIAVVAATDAHEGPVHVPDENALYFTTVPRPGPAGPRVDIRRVDLTTGRLTTLRPDANAANGMALGLDGRLVVCEQGSRSRPAAITMVDRATGDVEPLVDSWLGLPLNSPNDVAVRSDGTLWFTDPSYGYLQGFRSPPAVGDHVYRFDPRNGALSVVADDFDKPNGLAFSPDELTLYVGDSGRPRHVLAYDVVDGGRLAGDRVLAVIDAGSPDGIAVDRDGRVLVSSSRGVQLFEPDGTAAGEITVPGSAVNFTFSGLDGDLLFITADDAIWAATLNHDHTRS